ncbi:MAG: hypothetical protein H6621_02350 [Halobacteriovoraceae bacterium]|nr:hypothetical protein [Halobacteriovoraceae bacterium]MCB9093885.1 hypothetical protein [Halobacteriovoraceae bacterium]
MKFLCAITIACSFLVSAFADTAKFELEGAGEMLLQKVSKDEKTFKNNELAKNLEYKVLKGDLYIDESGVTLNPASNDTLEKFNALFNHFRNVTGIYIGRRNIKPELKIIVFDKDEVYLDDRFEGEEGTVVGQLTTPDYLELSRKILPFGSFKYSKIKKLHYSSAKPIIGTIQKVLTQFMEKGQLVDMNFDKKFDVSSKNFICKKKGLKYLKCTFDFKGSAEIEF